MIVSEFLGKIRARLDDLVGGSSERYWKDSELIDDYANEARDDFFQEVGDLIHDSTTTVDANGLPLCVLSLVVGAKSYDYSPVVLEILSAQLASNGNYLSKVTQQQLVSMYPNWRTEANGTPTVYSTDIDTDKIVVIPPPKVVDTVCFSVSRRPLARMSVDSDVSLGFKEELQINLIPYVMHLAFRKQDSEIVNPTLSKEFKADYDDRVQLVKVREINKRIGRGTVQAHRGTLPK